jgi:hypothetical protein
MNAEHSPTYVAAQIRRLKRALIFFRCSGGIYAITSMGSKRKAKLQAAR